MNYNLFIVLIIIIIIILIINILNYYNKIDNFNSINRANYNDDGKMKFDYLTDPSYKAKILNRYYINDDKKQNGVKINNHPYAVKHKNCEVKGARPYVYGNIWCQRKPGGWNRYENYGQDIYNSYGIRR
jgi:hypothetical protein